MKEPLQLIKQILESDLSFIELPENKNPKLSTYKKAINNYAEKRAKQDCLKYLNNDDAEKLVLLDAPYIGSENTCSVAGCKYPPFHKKAADYLQSAIFPFLYYCRSTPPKSDKIFNEWNGKHIMKMKLAQILTIQFDF